MKIAYQTNAAGFFIGTVEADESPLEPGVHLIPGGAVEIPPPSLPPGSFARWVDGGWQEFVPAQPLPQTPPVADPAELLAAERQGMICSRLQGRLVLGEATCAQIDALAADPATPWAMRETILNAIEWRRTSQAMTELGYLLGYTGEQMDALFRVAMTVEV